MEKKIQRNNRIIHILGDNNFSQDENKRINHTNINNNINITNYYHSPPHNYFNKGTLTFINENSIIQNIISCPIKTTTHRTQRFKNDNKSPINITLKKCHQCQSPYIKKILPNKNGQKSPDKNKINKILKTYPSAQFVTSQKIKILNNNKTRYEDFNTKYENKVINNNKCNDYFNQTKEKLFNNFKRGKNKEQKNIIHYNPHLSPNQIRNIKNKQIIYLAQSSPQFRTNDKNVSLFNVLEKRIELFLTNNNNYNSKTYKQNSINKYNFGSPKLIKNHYITNFLSNKDNFDEKKISKDIILIQSAFRGYLFRIKFNLYKTFINQIKKGYNILQNIYIKNKKRKFFTILKYNINNAKNKKFEFSDLIPSNNISVLFNKNNKNNNSNQKINSDKFKSQIFELQEELNNRKQDYNNLEKRSNELILENKKIQNINNIIVSDNKQLAMKLKNYEISRYSNLEIINSNFYFINAKKKKDNILIKLINKIENINKRLLQKNFYKFYFQTKLIEVKYNTNIKEKENLFIVKNKNFSLNKNIVEKNIINKEEENKILRNKKLKDIINHKNLKLYFFRNAFEKWMLRAIVLKNKEILIEKRKKKKEKFRQRKQRKLYYNNKKTNDEENDNSYDSEDYKEEQYYHFNKHKYNKKYNNNYYEEKYE